jgi:hypothetical protein
MNSPVTCGKMDLGFCACAIIHVASAPRLECDAFWSFEPRSARQARLEGLNTP